MSERDNKLNIIEQFKILIKSIDKYDRHYYYLDLKNKKKPALIVMQLSHTGNGYINGSYVNTSAYKTTKAGDINIKNLTDAEIIQLIDEAIHNLT
ncbi:MAG: hypothetical protein H6Q59_1071 [Firmicutes bacterium]|nr:hypothetical protein [Bacillota bacterium]